MSSPGIEDFTEIEKKWVRRWDEMGLYKFDLEEEGEVFSIDTPPRYASGYLHMGHAKNYLEFDIIGRAMRLLGYNVFFPVGYDDNGLPTEKYVEEELGINKREVKREEFILECKRAALDLEEHMTETFRRIGMSWDWSTFYRTIDDRVSKTAQYSFLDLYKRGRLYRNYEPTIWCPYHQTALAQAEVEDKERETLLNYLYFDLKEGGKIEIATTRPELLSSCVAVFVHPEDERYGDLVGKKAKVPLFGQEVPIMEGVEVDREFGSGIVMVCTFGDNTDIEMWKRYDLPLRISIDEDGRINERGGPYEGMKIEESKKAIIADLKEKDIIFDQEEIHQSVGCCWRCENPVEFIPTQQWFIKTLDLKDELLELGDEIDWYPSYYNHRYRDWVENLKWDWCISRQRYYGVPFPVWYCRECEEVIIADQEELPVDPRKGDEGKVRRCDNCGSTNIEPETDVMDTWMTSSLTPQIAAKWREDEDFFDKIFPMSLRPQSHDIIRTWAFYTILKSHLHNGSIPWKDVMISGYLYTQEGVGMSSSKGTGVSPENIIKDYGADCLRYWAAGARTGEDIVYEEKDVIRGKKVLTKVWNAANLVGIHLDDFEGEEVELSLMDRWILTRMNEVIESCEGYYRNYDSSKVRREVSNFFKNVFCDEYLEMVKYRLYSDEGVNDLDRQAALYTLYHSLLANLKVMNPIIPFITEEIYHRLYVDKEGMRSIQETSWPEIPEHLIDEEAKETGELVKDIIARIRKWKSDKGIPLNQEIGKVRVISPSLDIKGCEKDIVNTVKATELQFIQEEDVEEKAVEIKPKYQVLGPKFKDHGKEIFQKIEDMDSAEGEDILKKGYIELQLDDGTSVKIEEDELQIEKGKTHEGSDIETLSIGDTLVLLDKLEKTE